MQSFHPKKYFLIFLYSLQKQMKLFLLLAPSLLAKTPHNREDVEKMSDQERKEFDRDILFDSDEEDSEWDPYELETGDIHERLGKVVEKIDANRLNYVSNVSPVLNPVRFNLFGFYKFTAKDS